MDRKVVSSIQVGFYQIDSRNTAQIGMSGGPALTSDGKVIGILHAEWKMLSCYRQIDLYPGIDQLLPSSLLSSPSAGPGTPHTPRSTDAVHLGGTLGSSQRKALNLKPRIEALEKMVFEDVTGAQKVSLRQRVASLEEAVSGEEQTGSLEARVSALEEAV